VSIRPSSLPMLAQCPRFESGGDREFADDGTRRHEALAENLKAHCRSMELDEPVAAPLMAELDEESAEAVQWAADYIRLHAPMSDYPLRIEERVHPLRSDFTPYFENGGTADAICGSHLFDFKWRERNYDEQLAAYALALCEQGHETVTVHILFGATRRAQSYKLDEESARALVDGVIEKATAPDAQPSPCDYCGWCAHRLTCKPYLRTVKRVAEGYADEPLLSQVKTWHPSDITTPEEMALVLTIKRKLLDGWGKSVEFHAKEMAKEMVEKQGLQLPGYELKSSEGKQHVSDVAAAHEALGLPVSDFLKCCALRLNSSKKYPDRVGVTDAWAAANGVKKTPAKKRVTEKLGALITRGKPSMKLKAVDGSDSADESED
jgi:hypothetical protein